MLSLPQVMYLNATSCIVFGVLFLIAPLKVGLFLSQHSTLPTLVVMTVGGILVINGFHLIWGARQSKPKEWLVWYFSLGDFLWVLASLVMVILGIGITSSMGILATVLVAVMVGSFGILQLAQLKNINRP
ncbi:hypothetical protein [Echinimonas agarilytica]|uniref:Uncharacterized protein n=1 Tax=Echinimonas agarilytica TaxID=1215918 RepID=A0AA41W5X0_9GAMM|nr:hypothetical protein [Echinimonas agarilytica]MCM2679153.1 hypothetical protein [Echinimonas agarilytica]